MANKKMSIVIAWNWFVNVIDTNILTSSEQLIIVHLIKYLNRNYWKPVKIEPQILAKSTNKDNRTVKKALSTLINKGFIIQTKSGGLTIGNNINAISNPDEPNTSDAELFADFENTGNG